MHFPDERTILEMTNKLIGAKKVEKLRKLKEGQSVFDMPLISDARNKLGRNCECRSCSDNPHSKEKCE
jgi:hypothetical protein